MLRQKDHFCKNGRKLLKQYASEEPNKQFRPDVHLSSESMIDLYGLITEGGWKSAMYWIKTNCSARYQKSIVYPFSILTNHGYAALSEQPGIYVGTIHSFKGAEADVVFVIPDLSRAGYEEWIRGGTNRDAIIRTFYVAMTRARDKLVSCPPASPYAVSLDSAIQLARSTIHERMAE